MKKILILFLTLVKVQIAAQCPQDIPCKMNKLKITEPIEPENFSITWSDFNLSKNNLNFTLLELEYITPNMWIGIGFNILKAYFTSSKYKFVQKVPHLSSNLIDTLELKSKYNLTSLIIPKLHFYPLIHSRYNGKGKDFLELYLSYCAWAQLNISPIPDQMKTDKTLFKIKAKIFDVGIGLNFGIIPFFPIGLECGIISMEHQEQSKKIKYFSNNYLTYDFPAYFQKTYYFRLTIAFQHFYPADLKDNDGLTTFPLLRHALSKK